MHPLLTSSLGCGVTEFSSFASLSHYCTYFSRCSVSTENDFEIWWKIHLCWRWKCCFHIWICLLSQRHTTLSNYKRIQFFGLLLWNSMEMCIKFIHFFQMKCKIRRIFFTSSFQCVWITSFIPPIMTTFVLSKLFALHSVAETELSKHF